MQNIVDTERHAAANGYLAGWLSHPLARALQAAGIVSLVLFVTIPFPWHIPLVALAAMALVWLETGSLRALGFTRPTSWKRSLLWALGVAVFGILFVDHVLDPFLHWLTGTKPDLSGLGPLEGNLKLTLAVMGQAMFSAAIAEEIVFRGFLLHHLTRLFGTVTMGRWIAIIVGSGIFAAAHFGQGLVGMVEVAAVAVAISWAFLRSGRDIWAMILAHALTDIWGLTMVYLGWY